MPEEGQAVLNDGLSEYGCALILGNILVAGDIESFFIPFLYAHIYIYIKFYFMYLGVFVYMHFPNSN